jgi:FkbM family methyltransferase
MSDLRSELVELLEQEPPPSPAITGDELVIYAAGGAGRAVAAAARARGLKVRAFLDARAASLGEIDGIPCYAPASEEADGFASKGLPVIVAVFNYATDLRPISQLLRARGFKRVISFYEAHEQLEMAPQFWLGSRTLYRPSREKILSAFDLFEDETSRKVFRDQIALRLTFDTSLLSEPDQTNHYLPADLPALATPLRMIDGGAFTGDTIQLFLEKGVPLEAVAAFEPDVKNFAELREGLARASSKIRERILFPCGLSNRTAMRSFAAGAGAASALQLEGDTAIQVVALDDVLPTFAPTFLKLDIEGAEPDALQGAAQTITRFVPRLAVCVYHAPEHLWELPHLIRELHAGYDLALRYHQFNGFDVVLYAIAR